VAGQDLWAQTECTLAFRLHLNYLRHRYATSAIGLGLKHLLRRVHGGLCTANAPMGYLPLELMGEILYLHRASTKGWDASAAMYLSAWKAENSVSPTTWLFLHYTVPMAAKEKWSQMPLETEAETEEREAAGSDSEQHTNSLQQRERQLLYERQSAVALRQPAPMATAMGGHGERGLGAAPTEASMGGHGVHCMDSDYSSSEEALQK
jgi:hypothetical protein